LVDVEGGGFFFLETENTVVDKNKELREHPQIMHSKNSYTGIG
jgi:hypothetical protein